MKPAPFPISLERVDWAGVMALVRTCPVADKSERLKALRSEISFLKRAIKNDLIKLREGLAAK
jgi:hypothetical protein